jgi:hypothetical protein
MIDELVNLLVEGEVPLHEETVDQIDIRELPREIDTPAIDGPHLDDTIRITGGEGKRWAVEIDHHAGDGGIDERFNGRTEIEQGPCTRIAVPGQLSGPEYEPAGDLRGDFDASMRNRDQERVAHGHRTRTFGRVFVKVWVGRAAENGNTEVAALGRKKVGDQPSDRKTLARKFFHRSHAVLPS